MSFQEEMVLGASRVDKAWEEQHSADRRAAWEVTRAELNRERQEERAKTPLGVRIQNVIMNMTTISQLKAGAIAAQSPSAADGNHMPPFTDEYAVGYLHRDDVIRYLQLTDSDNPKVALRAVEALEAALDSENGHGAPTNVASMITEEKDRMILTDMKGLRPEEVFALQPALGSPRVIRRVRLDAGRDPNTGA